MKLKEKSKARQLRHQGFSIKQIATTLDVSKSSVSAWVRDIELSEEILINIDNQRRLGRERSRKTRLSNIADRNILLNIKCKEEILPFCKRDLWIAGLMLYAGEGTKSSQVRNQNVRIASADPRILRIFINFLIQVCSVTMDKLRVCLFLYEDINHKEALKFWLRQLNIPKQQFRNSFIKKSYSNSKYRRRSNYGTAHIYVYDARLYRKIMGWIQATYEFYSLDSKRFGK